MEDTLFITDMDGTLLDNSASLSPYSVETINRFIASGGYFSIATARSHKSSKDILVPLNLTLPIVLNNGAIVYDKSEHKFTNVSRLPEKDLKNMADIFEEQQLWGFLFTLDGKSTIKLFHRPLVKESDWEYRNSRYELYDRNIFECEDLTDPANDFIPFFCVVYGEEEHLNEVAGLIDGLEGLQTSIYSDVYNDQYFMDIYSKSASKYTGAKWICEQYGISRIAAFGDNYNDISMLLSADESYVTSNGVEEAKAVATGVIGDCNEDAVAKFLAERFSL